MQFIKYIGTAHRRIISADDFRRAGIPNQQTVEWSYANNFSVPIDSLSEEVLRKAIEPDPLFIVVGGEEHEPRFLGQRMTPAQAAGPRVDMMGAVNAKSTSAALSQPFTSGSGATPGGGGSTPTTVTTGPGSGTDS